MKPIASMFFVLAAALILASPAQARYADGMNTYAAYHVMHGGMDPSGFIKVDSLDVNSSTGGAVLTYTLEKPTCYISRTYEWGNGKEAYYGTGNENGIMPGKKKVKIKSIGKYLRDKPQKATIYIDAGNGEDEGVVELKLTSKNRSFMYTASGRVGDVATAINITGALQYHVLSSPNGVTIKGNDHAVLKGNRAWLHHKFDHPQGKPGGTIAVFGLGKWRKDQNPPPGLWPGDVYVRQYLNHKEEWFKSSDEFSVDAHGLTFGGNPLVKAPLTSLVGGSASSFDFEDED